MVCLPGDTRGRFDEISIFWPRNHDMGDVPGILVEQMRTVRLGKGADDSGPTA